MTEIYISPRARRDIGARDLVDEVDGWQLQYAPIATRAGIAFKVTDIRDERRRRLTPDKPWRRVYDVVYNTRADRCSGPHWMSLADHHPDVAAWAAREIAAYCRRMGLATKPGGGGKTANRLREKNGRFVTRKETA